MGEKKEGLFIKSFEKLKEKLSQLFSFFPEGVQNKFSLRVKRDFFLIDRHIVEKFPDLALFHETFFPNPGESKKGFSPILSALQSEKELTRLGENLFSIQAPKKPLFQALQNDEETSHLLLSLDAKHSLFCPEHYRPFFRGKEAKKWMFLHIPLQNEVFFSLVAFTLLRQKEALYRLLLGGKAFCEPTLGFSPGVRALFSSIAKGKKVSLETFPKEEAFSPELIGLSLEGISFCSLTPFVSAYDFFGFFQTFLCDSIELFYEEILGEAEGGKIPHQKALAIFQKHLEHIERFPPDEMWLKNAQSATAAFLSDEECEQRIFTPKRRELERQEKRIAYAIEELGNRMEKKAFIEIQELFLKSRDMGWEAKEKIYEDLLLPKIYSEIIPNS